MSRYDLFVSKENGACLSLVGAVACFFFLISPERPEFVNGTQLCGCNSTTEVIVAMDT